MTALELFSQGFGDIIKRKILWFSLFPKHFLRAGVAENIRSGIEVVITGLTRNQFGSNPTRVRIPPAAPRRRGRHIVRGDFLQKSRLTHFVAAPLQTATALLGCGLVLDTDLRKTGFKRLLQIIRHNAKEQIHGKVVD